VEDLIGKKIILSKGRPGLLFFVSKEELIPRPELAEATENHDVALMPKGLKVNK
jgi:hypothetical protein